jgi:hypothetical protein
MDSEREAVEFKRAVRRAGPHGPGRRYPLALKRAGVEYLRPRQAAGAPVVTAARELGLGRGTLMAWTMECTAAAQPAFVPVSVVTDATAPSLVVVYGPNGLRVEGLDVAGVVALQDQGHGPPPADVISARPAARLSALRSPNCARPCHIRTGEGEVLPSADPQVAVRPSRLTQGRVFENLPSVGPTS